MTRPRLTPALCQLENRQASCEDLYGLVEEVIKQITVADKRAATLRTRADDPALAPDARAARQAAEDAEQQARRLRTLEVRLREHLSKRLDAEQRDRYRSDFDRVKVIRGQAAEKFAKVPDLIKQLADIFAEAKHADALISQLHSTSPAGEAKRLPTISDQQLDKTVLFDSSGQVWPPRQTLDAARLAPVPSYSEDHSPFWWKKHERERLEREARDAEELSRLERERKSFYGQPQS
jgi:hypothetical protein